MEVATFSRYTSIFQNYKYFAGAKWYVSATGQLFGELICQNDRYSKDLIEGTHPSYDHSTTLKMLSLHTLCQIQENTWYHINTRVTSTSTDKIVIPGITPYYTVAASVDIKINGSPVTLYPMGTVNASLGANINYPFGIPYYNHWGFPYYISLLGNINTNSYFRDMALSDVPLEEGYSLG